MRVAYLYKVYSEECAWAWLFKLLIMHISTLPVCTWWLHACEMCLVDLLTYRLLHKDLQRTLKLTLLSTLLSRCTQVTVSCIDELAGARMRRVDSSNCIPFKLSFLVSVATVVESIPSRVLPGLSTSKLNISWLPLPAPIKWSLLQAKAVEPIVWHVNVTSVLAHATCPSLKLVLVIVWAFVPHNMAVIQRINSDSDSHNSW